MRTEDEIRNAIERIDRIMEARMAERSKYLKRIKGPDGSWPPDGDPRLKVLEEADNYTWALRHKGYCLRWALGRSGPLVGRYFGAAEAKRDYERACS